MYDYTTEKNHPAADMDLSKNADAHHYPVHALAQLRPVYDDLEAWMDYFQYPAKDVFAATVAFHEAVVNAFDHGNRRDTCKLMKVSYLVTPAEVLVTVEDEGRGFDPQQVPDPRFEALKDRPGGQGLFLIRAYTSWVCFNAKGNRVTFCRQRSAS